MVLADCERNDWLLCQITSDPYADTRAIQLTEKDFLTGLRRATGFAGQTKLFTAKQSLIAPPAIGVIHNASSIGSQTSLFISCDQKPDFIAQTRRLHKLGA